MLISVDSLSKKFGQVDALREIRFELPEGGRLAIVGTNGSGKTTLIRILLGLIDPDMGHALIDGKRYTADHSSRVGYLPEDRGNFQRDTVLDVLTLFARLRGFSHNSAQLSALEYLEFVGLSNQANTPINKLSNGQQQKVHLGITLAGRPEILILDEPTRGFDPVNKDLFVEITRDILSDGATLLLVSHQMSEVEVLADRIIFLKDAEIIRSGPIRSIKESWGPRTLCFSYVGHRPEEVLGASITQSTDKLTAEIAGLDPSIHTSAVIRELLENGVEITGFHERVANLDEIFISTYGGMGGNQAGGS